MPALPLAFPLVLEYIVMRGNGGGLISKRHNVLQYNADAATAADVRCGQTLNKYIFVSLNEHSNIDWQKGFQ